MLDNFDQEILWKFIRGDLSTSVFEQWLYTNKNFEQTADNAFYLEAISTDFNHQSELVLLKKNLENFLRQRYPLNCECITLNDVTVIDIGSDQRQRVFHTIVEIEKYGRSRWWLSLDQCNRCEQYWLVAEESMINDIDILKRLEKSVAEIIIQKNEWPPYFQTREELLTLGKENNRSVKFVNRFSFSLVNMAQDLKKERPTISFAEMAALLNIDTDHARDLCKKPWWKFW